MDADAGSIGYETMACGPGGLERTSSVALHGPGGRTTFAYLFGSAGLAYNTQFG
jgi:hypothetical protein